MSNTGDSCTVKGDDVRRCDIDRTNATFDDNGSGGGPPDMTAAAVTTKTAVGGAGAKAGQAITQVAPSDHSIQKDGTGNPSSTAAVAAFIEGAATDLFHKCLKNAIPTGNLYSGSLGISYLLLEYCDYQQQRQRQQSEYQQHQQRTDHPSTSVSLSSSSPVSSSPNPTSNHPQKSHRYCVHPTTPSSGYSPYRCKRLLQQALNAAREATVRSNQRSSKTSRHNNSISLFESDWMGSHALLVACLCRLRFVQRELNGSIDDGGTNVGRAGGRTRGRARGRDRNMVMATPTGSTMPKPTTSGGTKHHSTTIPVATQKPRRQQLLTVNTTTATPTAMASSSSASGNRSNRSNSSSYSSSNDDDGDGDHPNDTIQDVSNRPDHVKHVDDDECRSIVRAILGRIMWQHSQPTTLNCDVVGGRAGAIQTIFWLRSFIQDDALGRHGVVVPIVTYILEQGRTTATIMGLNGDDDDENDEENHNDSDACDDRDNDDIPHHHAATTATATNPRILFWLCDTQGTHKAYLGAGRGVVGILYTLLGLSPSDWDAVEQQEGFTTARLDVRRTIDECFMSWNNIDLVTNTTTVATAKNDSKDGPIHPVTTPSTIPTFDDATEEKKSFSDDTVATNDKMSTIINGPTQTEQQPHLSNENEQHQRTTLSHRFVYPKSGNLRPYLDASMMETEAGVDWFQGATGLAMLLMQAAIAFNSKIYLQEAHRLCDAIIFPRGLQECCSGHTISGSTVARGGGSTTHFAATTATTTVANVTTPGSRGGSVPIGHSSQHSHTSTKSPPPRHAKSNGPVSTAGRAFCFFQLSQLCSRRTEEDMESHKMLESLSAVSLSGLWRDRSILFAQLAYHEWLEYLETVPVGTTPGWNPFSLYEGMGGLVSLLWQLATSSDVDTSVGAVPSSVQLAQMPLFSGGWFATVIPSSLQSILLSASEVTLLVHAEPVPIPKSPPPIKRTNKPVKSLSPERFLQPSEKPRPKTPQGLEKERQIAEERRKLQEQLAESRRRRAAFEEEAEQRRAREEEALRRRQEDIKARKALADAKRKADLEARKQAQLAARKRADELEEEDAKRKAEDLARKQAEEEARRTALLAARKQAQERVAIRRKAKEEEERRIQEAEAKRKADELLLRRKAVEEEAKKRKAMMEAILKRKEREAEIARQQEREKVLKEEEHRRRRLEDLKEKEQERKRKEDERKRRLEAVEQKRKDEETRKRLEEEEEKRKRDVDNANRRMILEAKLKRQKEKQRKQEREAEELRLREKLREALEAEAKRQRLAEKIARKDEELKRQKEKTRLSPDAVRSHNCEEETRKEKDAAKIGLVTSIQNPIDLEEEKYRLGEESFSSEIPLPPAPHHSLVYSPSVLQKKDANPLHFFVPTKESLFWSLQTETNIGDSENYKPALVATPGTTDANGVSNPVTESLISTNATEAEFTSENQLLTSTCSNAPKIFDTTIDSSIVDITGVAARDEMTNTDLKNQCTLATTNLQTNSSPVNQIPPPSGLEAGTNQAQNAETNNENLDMTVLVDSNFSPVQTHITSDSRDGVPFRTIHDGDMDGTLTDSPDGEALLANTSIPSSALNSNIDTQKISNLELPEPCASPVDDSVALERMAFDAKVNLSAYDEATFVHDYRGNSILGTSQSIPGTCNDAVDSTQLVLCPSEALSSHPLVVSPGVDNTNIGTHEGGKRQSLLSVSADSSKLGLVTPTYVTDFSGNPDFVGTALVRRKVTKSQETPPYRSTRGQRHNAVATKKEQSPPSKEHCD